jgi:hypothetical protein
VSSSSDNPFSTRCVRPGAIAYRFPAGCSADKLVDRLQANGWRGQIVGPHGSGKSTLLAALIEAIRKRGRAVLLIELHDGQRRLPKQSRLSLRSTADALVIVDGYEQLSHFSRMRLKRLCAKRGLGLLVTAHADVGFPTLVATSTTVELAKRLATELLAGQEMPLCSGQFEEIFSRHRGNMREVLFELYDLYESRR